MNKASAHSLKYAACTPITHTIVVMLYARRAFALQQLKNGAKSAQKVDRHESARAFTFIYPAYKSTMYIAVKSEVMHIVK